ncbi:MAG: PfkB family carbohydrate kinase [Actinomycetota bacterium]|nr:PfkB family carbohydrate kinase [Actinomycetota bacterium]
MDLVCVGDVMLDVHVASGALARGGDVHGRVAIRPGGTSANSAVWAAWAGASAAVIAAVGDDLAGTLCVDAVGDRGVDVGGVVRRSSPTGVMVVMTEDGERSMVADRGANAQLATADVEGIDAAAVLVSGYLFLQEPGHDVAVAAIGGVRTPLLAVEAASWPLLETFGVERFFEETASCDAVLANEREARVLTGNEGDDAARALGERYRFAAVKRAASGATLIAEGRLVAADGEAIEEVEATGAGDAFDGVLLCSLARERGPEEALARACHAGALVAASPATWPEESGA